MRHEIRKLQKEVGVTTLFVTHDQDEALMMADRIVVLNQARIEQIDTPGNRTGVPSWTCWSSFRIGGWLSLVPGVASVARLPKRLPHAKPIRAGSR
jgi:energy-coupling factor transporter ATP-binding protein EcfA2